VPAAAPERPGPGRALVRVLRVGFCGTDHDLVRARHAETPPGEDHLVLGHEVVGAVEAVAPDVEGVRPGQVVVAAARRGCGGCGPCRAGRADFCAGGYVEYGIHGRHGFARPLVEVEAENLVGLAPELWRLGMLAEPLGVVEKALEQAELAARRVPGERPARPRALVAGAGSLGLLAVFLLRRRGHEVVAFDRRPAGSRSARLAAAAGASYHDTLDGVRDEAGERGFDLVLEATGSAGVLLALLPLAAPNSAVVLLGVSKDRETLTVELRGLVRRLVVRHVAIVPVVNAGPVHLAAAAGDLAGLAAVPGFAEIVTGVHPPDAFAEALRPAGGVKECLEFAAL
jgi:glucose 1-dehydrogenase